MNPEMEDSLSTQISTIQYCPFMGGQWLCGKSALLETEGLRFKSHKHHCIESLSKTHCSLLSTGSTQEDLSRHNCNIVDWDIKNQIKQTNSPFIKLCLGYIEINLYISESCYKGIILQRNVRKITIKVMLHMKLKGMMHRTSCKQIFCPFTSSQPLGRRGVNRSFFLLF